MLVPTDPLDLALLERAQDLRLQPERHVTDLVQEQRAAVRHLEATRLSADCAGECAFLVTEQLGFEQPLGDGGTVDGDEWTIGARAERVEGARKELLARAAFALEEHGGVGGRGAVQLLRGRAGGLDPRR